MAGGNPAVLPRSEPASASTAVAEENLEDRVRSLRLSSIPQGSDWFRSLVLLVVGVGFLGLLYYLIRGTVQGNRGAASADASAEQETGDKSAANGGQSSASANNSSAGSPTSFAGKSSKTAHEAQGNIIPAH